MLYVVAPPTLIPLLNCVKLETPTSVLLFGRLMFPARVRVPALLNVFELLKNCIFPPVAFVPRVIVPVPARIDRLLLDVVVTIGDEPARVIFAPLTVRSPPVVVSPVPVVNVLAPVCSKLPFRVSVPVPPKGLILTLPVLPSPIVKSCVLVVPITPLPVINVALSPFDAEILAVGVPEFTLITANFADWVDVPPRAKSKVVLIG